MENEKIGFFKRIKIAITKLENYDIFLNEKTSIAVKYFFLIVLILSIVVGVSQTYNIMKMVTKGYDYVKNELPDFSYQDDILKFENDFVYGYDKEYDAYVIADTSDEISSEKMQEYIDTIKSSGIIFLKDKMIYVVDNNKTEYIYSEIASQYELKTLDKVELIDKIESVGMIGISATIFCLMFISMYFIQLVSIIMDWLLITIFAFISARICKLKMTLKQCFNISIYGLTLSIILSMLYNVAYYVGGFYTDYFRTVYLLISYIYVVAAILLMKSDVAKQQVEIGKIEETQKQVHKEMEEQEEKDDTTENKTPDKEEKNEEKQKEDDSNNEINTDIEPDGSEI